MTETGGFSGRFNCNTQVHIIHLNCTIRQYNQRSTPRASNTLIFLLYFMQNFYIPPRCLVWEFLKPWSLYSNLFTFINQICHYRYFKIKNYPEIFNLFWIKQLYLVSRKDELIYTLFGRKMVQMARTCVYNRKYLKIFI